MQSNLILILLALCFQFNLSIKGTGDPLPYLHYLEVILISLDVPHQGMIEDRKFLLSSETNCNLQRNVKFDNSSIILSFSCKKNNEVLYYDQ